MNQPIELSLEQEFSLRSFADQVQQMSCEQVQEFLIVRVIFRTLTNDFKEFLALY